MEVNTHAFNGLLDFSGIEIKICNSKTYLGAIGFSGSQIFGYEVSCLKISKKYDFTREELKNIIAHELIHIYEIQILNIKPGHGKNFHNTMKKLNEMGYNVEVVSKKQIKPEAGPKEVIYVVSENKAKIIFTTKNCFEKIKNDKFFNLSFGNYESGKVSYSDIAGKYTLMRKYKGFYTYSELAKSAIGA